MERCINTLKTSNDDHAQKMMESQNLHQTIYFSASTSVSSGSRSCSDEVFQEKCSPKMCSDNRKSVRFSREQQDEQNELIMDQSSKNIEASEGHLAHQTMSDTSAMENMILHIAVDSEQQQGCTDNKNSLNHEVSEGDESDDQEIEDVIVIQEANFHSSAPSSNLKATLDNKSLLLQLEKTENELKERMTENSDLKAKYRDLMVVVEELEAQHNNKVENVISSNSLDNDGNSSVLDENRNLLLKLEKMESELKESNAENMDLKEKYCELMKMEENFSFLEKERDTLLKENILLKEKVQLLTEQSYNGDDGDSNYECKYDIVLPSRRSRMKREVKSYYEDSEVSVMILQINFD